MVLVARCELNALLDPNVPENERKYLSIKTLIEYFGSSTPSNWSSRLDSQRAAVLLTEFKNNAAKMTRFTAQALLAGVDQIKLGLISRANPSNPRQHRILGTETYQPAILARTVKLYISNMWGVLQGIFNMIAKQEGDAVFVLLHAPNKQQLDLYKVNNEQDLLNESSVASDVTDQEQEEQEA
jgi:translation initiation factor 3 subunit D